MKYAERAVKVAPDEAEPHRFLGYLLLENGSDDALQKALGHLLLAVKIRPDFFEAYNDLGRFWKLRGNLKRASQAHVIAHRLSPGDPVALYNLGVIAFEKGEVQVAIGLFQKTLNVDPSYTLARYALERLAPQRQPGPLTR